MKGKYKEQDTRAFTSPASKSSIFEPHLISYHPPHNTTMFSTLLTILPALLTLTLFNPLNFPPTLAFTICAFNCSALTVNPKLCSATNFVALSSAYPLMLIVQLVGTPSTLTCVPSAQP